MLRRKCKIGFIALYKVQKQKDRIALQEVQNKEIVLLYLLTYSLHGAESFLRSELVLQLIKKFPAFYGTHCNWSCMIEATPSTPSQREWSTKTGTQPEIYFLVRFLHLLITYLYCSAVISIPVKYPHLQCTLISHSIQYTCSHA